MRNASRFGAGGVYECRCCGRRTRATGRGDNEFVGYCAECYDLGGEENHLEDMGCFSNGPADVLRMIAVVAERGGDASGWGGLKAAAEAALAEAA